MRREAPVGPSTRAHLLLISLRCQLAVASVQNSPVSVSWEKYVITTPGAAWLSVRFATEGPLGMERSAWGCTAGDWLARYPATPSTSCSAIFVRALQAERERKGATRHTGGSPAGPQENWGSARPPGSLRTVWRNGTEQGNQNLEVFCARRRFGNTRSPRHSRALRARSRFRRDDGPGHEGCFELDAALGHRGRRPRHEPQRRPARALGASTLASLSTLAWPENGRRQSTSTGFGRRTSRRSRPRLQSRKW